MTTNIKMWSKVPMDEVRKNYFAIHKGLGFIGIIMANINKRWADIQKVLFDNDKGELKFTDVDGELLSITKIKKSIKEVKKSIKLPS